jgi:ribokinase
MRAFVIGNYMSAHFMGVERLPADGESLQASAHFAEHGGKGLNLGVGLHRLGVSIDLLMAVGEDAAGTAVRNWLAEEGIDTGLVLRLGPDSGFGVGFIAPDGRNFLVAHPGANARLTPHYLDGTLGALAAADWVLASFESPDALILHAFRHARRLGRRTYLNPSPWRPLPGELAALTDLVVVNAPEAALLFSQPGADAWGREEWAERLPALANRIAWTGALLVVTLAEAGSVALHPDGRCVARPAYAIAQVDATGAGDAFGSGLVWSLLRGEALDEALGVANACGALVAARRGILEGLPRPADLAAFMAAEAG